MNQAAIVDNQITIIIPTRNRLNYLNRLINYIKDQPFQYIIADNSTVNDDSFRKDNLPANIHYVKTDNPGFAAKVLMAVNMVKTPFVMMCADDDFLLTSALRSGIQFLNGHQEYSAVHGCTLSYYVADAKVGYGKLYPYDVNVLIDKDSKEERVKDIFSPYLPLFYSIHRTGNFKKIVAFEMNPENLNFVEYSIAFLAAAAGKVKVLPVLYHIREESLTSAGSSTTTIYQMSKDPKLVHKNTGFKKHLSDYLRKEYSVGNAENMVNHSMDHYLGWVERNTHVAKMFSYTYLKRELLKKYLPGVFGSLVQARKKQLVTSQGLSSVDFTLYQNSEAKQELSGIEKIILTYPIKTK